LKRIARIISAVLIVLVALTALACERESTSKITAVDDLGRPVYLEDTPMRVVSLAPSITETLFAIGVGDRLVGVTEAADYPEEAMERPKVGAYFATSPEEVLARDPDLVLTDGHDPAWKKLDELGIPTLVIQPKDIFGISRDILVLGKVMRKEKEAEKLVASLEERLEAVAEITSRASGRPTVYYELDGTDPGAPWTAGPGSFVDTLIRLAGGRNIAEAPGQWLQLSMETLVAADPDLIVLGNYPYVTPEQLGDRTGVWEKLTAVEFRKIHPISDSNLTSRPGPRIIDGLEELARIIHPELFPE
jgi:iron complex transport system substrate-binding protein